MGWLIHFGGIIGSIVLKNYRVIEPYKEMEALLYTLIFMNFLMLILAFVNIFRESPKMFLFLNISVILIISLLSIKFFVDGNFKDSGYLSSFIMVIGFIIGSVLMINYFRHFPAKNEIEEIGQKEE
ncbi:hypothetical protein [Chryseobacterium sp. CT-SW4]|uniref:hypothetical protein n=1 Tax=Chryseobacterium sp. SW-1 TaxID=3157343 RepID=UPI003B0166CD